ncbi:HYR domain-containing protein [Bradyrhizobium sp. UFLA05-109]
MAYSFMTLPGVSLTGINDSGQVVGNYPSFLYSNGVYTTLKAETSDPSVSFTEANNINNLGQIVGYVTLVNGIGGIEGFVYNSGTYTRIDDPSVYDQGTYVEPANTATSGINDFGQIVGHYYDVYTDQNGNSGQTYYAFLDSGGNFTHLNVSAVLSAATDINNAGQIVGFYGDTAGHSHGFLYSGGGFTTLDGPQGVDSVDVYALGINNLGQIVGSYIDANGVSHGWVYSNGSYTNFDYFPNITPYDINDSGQIVGVYSDFRLEGFIATPLSASLFTTGAETVNFNSLSTDQQAAISSGADLYNGLGDNDVVTLPDLANYNENVGNGKTLGWSASRSFHTDSKQGDHYIVHGGDGNDIIIGGDGTDIFDGGSGSDTMTGGNGFDVVTYGFAKSSVGLKLGADGTAFGEAQGDIITQFEVLIGSQFDDQISLGAESPQLVFGSGGSDLVLGSAQNDIIYGDYLYDTNPLGDLASEIAFLSQVGVSRDKLGIDGAPGNDAIYGYYGSDKLFGGPGSDRLFAGLPGPFGVPTPDDSANELHGGSGSDELYAWTFQDNLSDLLDGGEDSDTYCADGKDEISTFEIGEIAYYRTLAKAGLITVDSSGFGTTIRFFSDASLQATVVGELKVDNVVLATDLTFVDASIADIAAVQINRQIDSAPIIKAENADLIWQKYTAAQFTEVKKFLFKELVGGAATSISAKAVSAIVPILVKSGASDAIIDSFKEFAEKAGAEVIKTGATNLVFDNPILSPADIAKIAVKLTPIYQEYKWGFKLGELLTKELYLQISKEFDLFLNNLFPVVDSHGVFVLQNGQYAPAVSDGYISGATVFSDDNQNGLLDSTEALTTSDATGSFFLSEATGPLVAFGGTDTSTGLQFKGQLSAPSGSSVITPLTTLMALLASDASAEQKVLSSFGLSSSIDLNTFDPIAATKAGSADGATTTAAVAKVYDTVSLIASTLVAAGGEFSSGVKEAFAAIAAAIDGSGISLTNEAQVSALVAAAAQTDGLTLGQGVADSLAAIIVASNVLLDQKAQSGATGDELLKGVAAIEWVIQGTASNAIQQADNDPSELQSLVDAFTGSQLDDAISAALHHLGSDDTTPPTLTPVSDQTLEAATAAGVAASFSAAATDLVDGTLPVVFKEDNTVVHSGDIFSVGIHTITASAVDAAGNASSESFSISVVDSTAPTLTPVTDQTNEATSAAGATAFFTASASDAVDGTLPVVFKEGNTVVHSGDVFGIGTHTITATAVDAAGNQTSQNFKFNVVDTTAPTLTPVANQAREATSAAGAAAFFAASASDLVDGAATVVFKEGNTVVHSGDTFGLGNHIITTSTTDAAGNLSSETFTINVKDTTAPTLTLIADQTLQATTAAGAAAFFTTTASDLVDGTDAVSFMEGNKVVHSGDLFGVGVHTITASAVDAAGNSATDIFEINVLGAASNNHDPIARSDSNGVAKGKILSVSANKGVLANDRDADHDHLSVGSVNGSVTNLGHDIKGDYGTLTLNADGSYSYAASAKALPSQIFAQDTFTYTSADGHGGSDTSTLTFSVFDPSFTYKAGSNTIVWGDNGKSVLDGSGGHAVAYGGKGADVLIGGKGDILAGGKGPDQFVFRPEFGANTILDFDVKNDHLQFDDSIFNSIKSILDHTTNTALGAVISDGHGDSVLLLGVSKSQLLAHSSDLLIA